MIAPIEAARLIIADYAGTLTAAGRLDIEGCQSAMVEQAGTSILLIRGSDERSDWARNFRFLPEPAPRGQQRHSTRGRPTLELVAPACWSHPGPGHTGVSSMADNELSLPTEPVKASIEARKEQARQRAKAYYWQHRDEILAKLRKMHPRVLALQAGDKYYRSRPCPQHGDVLRPVKTGACPECRKGYGKRYYAAAADKRRSRAREYYRTNRAAVLAKKQAVRDRDPAAYQVRRQTYRSANRAKENLATRKRYASDLEASRAYLREYASRNRAHVRAYKAALQRIRRHRCRKQMAAWLTVAQVREMHTFYESAHARGMVVDHRVPLTPCRICGAWGLHVPWNLQELPRSANLQKKNRCDGCWRPETDR